MEIELELEGAFTNWALQLVKKRGTALFRGSMQEGKRKESKTR